ncbi:MAG TPA: cation diffusion facilitator family transporter [Acidothermaceae bacterium]
MSSTQTRNARRQQRLVIAITLNVAVVVAQIIWGLLAHSLGLLADAGHNLADVAGLAIAVIALRYSLRSATMARSFGHHRATILAALANGGLLLAVTGFVAVDAVLRLVHPGPVHGGIVALVALGAAALNGLGATLVHERSAKPGAHPDLNISAATLHLVSDAAVSLAVAAAGLVILLSHGTYWLDPAVSLVVCVAITSQAVRLLHRSADVLLESTPRAIDPEAVLAAVRDVATVVDVHDLHVWSLSSDLHAMSAHVAVAGHPTLEQAQATGERIKDMVASQFEIAHATIEMECEACPEPDPCALESPTAASGLQVVHPHRR